MPPPEPCPFEARFTLGDFVTADSRQRWIVGQGNVLLHIDRRFHGQLGLLHHRHLGRYDRVLLDLGQVALVGIDDAAVAAAAAAAGQSCQPGAP